MNIDIAIYNLQSGVILRFVSCPLDHAHLQCADGEEFFLNCPKAATNIINNEPVTIVPEPYIPTLEEAKTAKLIKITAAFNNAITSNLSSYTTTGLQTNITANARKVDLENAIQLRDKMVDETLASIPFRCFDNTFAMLSLAEIEQLIRELRDFGFSLYQRKWEREAAIEAATTVEAVEEIVW